ncbi:MAG: hypothetical protein JKX79_03105, partial [Labilibaculum sp.]|nr:hypothetical protein [Labilibaculum sp.]
IILLNFLITSCNDTDGTPVDEVCVTENHHITLDKYITKLSYTNLWDNQLENYEYTYNEFNLLAGMDQPPFNGSHERFFNYQCNNNVRKVSSNSNNTRKYTYNSENQLIAFSGVQVYHNDYEIVYNGNTISVIGTIDTLEDTEITLEINASNLITKVTRATNYSTFEYDVNGNLIKAKDFDLNNELLNSYELTYDEHPNPFYEQLSSIYLERFIHYFDTSASDGVYIFFSDNGFNFPYLRNNMVLLKDVGCTGCYPNLMERVYTYDSENYPTKIEESHVGAPPIIYNIEY